MVVATYSRKVDQIRAGAPRPCLSCYGLYLNWPGSAALLGDLINRVAGRLFYRTQLYIVRTLYTQLDTVQLDTPHFDTRHATRYTTSTWYATTLHGYNSTRHNSYTDHMAVRLEQLYSSGRYEQFVRIPTLMTHTDYGYALFIPFATPQLILKRFCISTPLNPYRVIFV